MYAMDRLYVYGIEYVSNSYSGFSDRQNSDSQQQSANNVLQ